MDRLKGWKTYLVAAVMFCTAGAEAIGWITHDQEQQIHGLLLPLLAAAFRSAI